MQSSSLSSPEDEGRSIATIPGTTNATVVVSSRDYGGSASLQAVLQFQLEDGTWSDAFYSSEVDEVGRFTGSASTGLPLDGNQNGIADSWEAQYSANGDPIDPDSDLDCMSGCGTMKTGDGFTAFEEYRGFHYVDRTNGYQIKWRSTDPARKRDLFVYDYSGLFAGDLQFFRGQFPDIELREVDQQTAELDDDAAPIEIKRLNVNSLSSIDVFPLLLLNASLPGNCDPSHGPIDAELGHAPDEPAATGPDSRAIMLDNAKIVECGQQLGFPLADWRQILVAHEIGHNLNLRHPTQLRGFAPVAYTNNPLLLQALPLDKYTYDHSPSSEIFTWLMEYNYSAPAQGLSSLWRLERVYPGLGVLGSVKSVTVSSPYYTNSGAPQRSLRKIEFENEITAQNVLVVLSWLWNAGPSGALANVMNWTPRFDPQYQSVSAYSFSDTDKQTACTKKVCN
ncbi:hypothetical protein [Paludibaculum fermentans]|uniref:Uncharacterized protein n=1 Tax=Paludibaculum fermentans TaxID=1473598 RepID=A0A7S7SKT3_PALFE|nr:hypothetical protein [Paludibaculum fermentans]QOY87370.1 hypothetical protein IRI77_32175 [Paludibaculum fermentans]